jgi:hypothetical protein
MYSKFKQNYSYIQHESEMRNVHQCLVGKAEDVLGDQD